MRKFPEILAFSLLLLTSCGHHPSKDEALIRGKLVNGAGEKLLILQLEPEGARLVDSITLSEDCTFTFTVKLKETGFFLLRKPGGNQAVTVAGPGQEIRIDGDYKRLPHGLTISGTEDAVLLHEFYEFSRNNQSAADSLQKFLSDHQYDPGFADLTIRTDSLFRKIWEDQKAYEINFVNKHCSSISSLLILNYSFGARPVLSLEEDLPYYIKVDSALSMAYPSNKQVLINRKRIEDFRMQKALKAGADR